MVEAGEGHAGIHGNEEGVEIFGVVFLVLVAGDGGAGGGDAGGEAEVDGIEAGVEVGGEEEKVAVGKGGVDARSVELGGGEGAVAEVEGEIGGGLMRIESKGEDLVRGDAGGVGREGEVKAVADVREARCAVGGEGFGDSGIRCLRVERHEADCEDKHGEGEGRSEAEAWHRC